jgi:transcriptional regulator with XRE-family HTH domain
MKKLRQLRKMARASQAELALRTGINRTRLSFAENGYLELTAEEQAKIRKVIAKTAETNAVNVRTAVGLIEDRALTTASA